MSNNVKAALCNMLGGAITVALLWPTDAPFWLPFIVITVMSWASSTATLLRAQSHPRQGQLEGQDAQ